MTASINTARVRALRLFLVVGLCVGGGQWARAAPPNLDPQPTDLAGNSERMVSYRHQEHLWQTGDGGLHLVFNRGTLAPTGLALYSSYDGGLSWRLQASFANTDGEGTADGQLIGDNLGVVFQTLDGNVVFRQLHHDAASRSWAAAGTDEVVYASSQWAAINPAFGVDANGAAWCAFLARDRRTGDANIRLAARAAGANTWMGTGLVFGPTERRTTARSARPLPVPGGMAMVYTVSERAYWAVRSNGAPLDGAWAVSSLFVGTPETRKQDPYASHFSLVTDDAGDIHFATIDAYNVLYFKYTLATGAWSGPTLLSDGNKTAYLQMGLVDGKVTTAWSVVRSGRGSIVSSPDGGATFTTLGKLVLPAAAPGVNYGEARVEMPTRATGSAVLFQQYNDNGLERVMRYAVSVP
jgi:hypothetical protein